MLTYEFESFLYIPVSLNILYERKNFHLLNGNYLSCNISTLIYEEVIKSGRDVIIVDLKEINLGDSRCFKIFNEFYIDDSQKSVVFINFNEKMESYLLNDCSDYLKRYSDYDIITSEEGAAVFGEKIHGNINNELSIFIKNIINKYIWDGEYHLKTSNVYINKYIDVKKIFSDPYAYYLVFFEMALLIKNNYSDQFDKLICSSYNGAVIATIVGQLLNVEVVHLMNLGPTISINNIHMAKKILPNRSYLFLSDMFCLGTEFNLTKTIVKLNNAQLIGGVAVIKYLTPAYESNIRSLVNIDDGDSFSYQVYIRKDGDADA